MWCSPTLFKFTSISLSIKKERMTQQHSALCGHLAHNWRVCIWFQVEWVAMAVHKIRTLAYPWCPHYDRWPQESSWKMWCNQLCEIGSRTQYRHQYNTFLINESICSMNYFFIFSLLVFVSVWFFSKNGLISIFFQIVFWIWNQISSTILIAWYEF